MVREKDIHYVCCSKEDTQLVPNSSEIGRIFTKYMKVCEKYGKFSLFSKFGNMTDQLGMTQLNVFTTITADLYHAQGLLGWSEKQFSLKIIPISKKNPICNTIITIFPFAFAKKGHFFDFYQNFLQYGYSGGPKTSIFGNYI